MSWLFSRVLVEEYLEDIYLDGEQSVQSSGNPTQQAYCAPDKMTVFSRLSQFGMTYKPLTDIPGEDLSMSSVVAFHVRTLAQQERGQESMESEAECGEKWHGSFVKYDPDSSSWKTHQCSLLGGLESFSETWPRWGLMRDGECWEQQMLVPHTSETESGLSEKLPTPQASDYITKKTSASWKAKGGVNFSLANPEIQAKWPTPRSCSAMAATITPESAWADNRFPNLETVVGRRMWPTPVKSDLAARRPTVNWAGTDLPSQVWVESGGRENLSLPPARLNPNWVEWLMGWPLGWTDLKPLETDRFQKWLDEHGSC